MRSCLSLFFLPVLFSFFCVLVLAGRLSHSCAPVCYRALKQAFRADYGLFAVTEDQRLYPNPASHIATCTSCPC